MVNSLKSFRRLRQGVEHRLEKRKLLHTMSLARYQLRSGLDASIAAEAGGSVLEAGAGLSPYRPQLAAVASSITTLDIDESRQVDVVGDVQAMDQIADEIFDTVFCTQVLEHLPRPYSAFSEFRRVLKPGGTLILSAPHLSMVHEAPQDYYRYTRFGLKHLCESNGFTVVKLESCGGVISFLSHTLSGGLLTAASTVPGLFWIAWAINYLALVRALGVLDSLIGLRSVLPRDHILVARRA